MGRGTRRTSLAVYILLRASLLAARCGIESEKVGWLFRPLQWKHGDTFLMCLSASQILSSWVLYPQSLPAIYIAFLNKHGGKTTCIVRGIKDLAFGKPLTSLALVGDYYKSKGHNVQLDPNMRVPCTMIHGSQDCITHIIGFLGPSYLRSLMLYGPIYVIPAIVMNHQALLKRPFSSFGKILLQTARSSLFLSTYCASAWIWSCVVFQAAGRCSPLLVATSTFPAGLALLIEKKSRRMEIALYCFARAVESFGICVGCTPPRHLDVILFSAATSFIMHCYAQHRQVFRSKYLHLLDWMFGIPSIQVK